MCRSLPEKNTFVHFPYEATDENNERHSLRRSMTCPGAVESVQAVSKQGDVQQSSHLERRSITSVGNSTRIRTCFATNALRKRCSTAAAPCWADYLSLNVQARFWPVRPQQPSKRVHSECCVQSNVWVLSTDERGCREVQQAFDDAATDAQREALTNELHGHVWEAIASPFANYVLQKSISMIGSSASQYVIDEIMSTRNGSIRASQHKYGCRVIQRLLEHCHRDQTDPLIDEILAVAIDVSKSQYGMYVICHILEKGNECHKNRLLKLVVASFLDLASVTYGRAVLSKALEEAKEPEVHSLRLALLEAPQVLAEMAHCRHGHCGVVSLLQSLLVSDRKDAWDKIVAQDSALPRTKFGRKVLDSINVVAEEFTCK